MTIGVKNQMGKSIAEIKKIDSIVTERVGDLVILRRKLYTGEKTNARTNPRTIYSKIGFKTKKDKIKSPIIMKIVDACLI